MKHHHANLSWCQNLWCYMLTKKLWRDCSHITISWGEQDQLLSSTENVWENREDQLALAPVAVTGWDWPEFRLSRGCVCVWLVSQSCQALYGLMDWGQPGSSDHGILHARTRVGYLLLLQVVSLTLGFNGASYVSCIDRWILHHQHHLGSLSRGLHSFSFPLVTWVWANPGR